MTKSQLEHIAVIMDGNGRWSKKHNVPTALGHKAGAEAAKKLLVNCLKLKIPFLTLYAFSSENWMRSEEEVNNLVELLRIYLVNEIDLLMKHDVRVRIIGQIDKFPLDVQKLISETEEKTKNNVKLNLQLALSYGGREEIVSACKKIIEANVKIDKLNEKEFTKYLYASEIPDPDLLIRTSGESRVSNFLLWQLAYTELYFTKTLWPDFNNSHFKKAIENFYKRERRYGLSK